MSDLSEDIQQRRMTQAIRGVGVAATDLAVERIRRAKHDQKINSIIRFLCDIEFAEIADLVWNEALECDDAIVARELFETAHLLRKARGLRLGVLADPGCQRCQGYGYVQLDPKIDVDCDCTKVDVR